MLRMIFALLAGSLGWAQGPQTPILESLKASAGTQAAPPDPGRPVPVAAPRLLRRSLGPFRVEAVEADLSSGELELQVGLPPRGSNSATLAQMARARKALAGINFSFFDPASMETLGPVLVPDEGGPAGRLLRGRGRFRGAIFLVAPDGTPRILSPQEADWVELRQNRLALAAGPLLLREGRVVVHPSIENEGFTRSPRFLHAPERSALALLPGGRILLVRAVHSGGGSLTFSELAELLLKLGARDALALDGGSSSGLYLGGKNYGHSRQIVNALLIVPSPR